MKTTLCRRYGKKICRRCFRELPLEQFHKNRVKPDGLDHKCKECCALLRAKEIRTCKSCGAMKSSGKFAGRRGICKACDSKAGQKTCHNCRRVKPVRLFVNSVGRPDGKCGTCRACRRREFAKNGSHWRRHQKYGIDKPTYAKLLADQNNCCAICGKPEKYRGVKLTPLVVDHNHETGEIRGLLCRGCNVGLGHLKDSTTVLEAAIVYLRKYGTKLKLA